MSSYVVKSGDSLSTIARDVLGDMSRWPELAQANQIESPYTIYTGQVLQLYDAPPSDVPASSGVASRSTAPGAVSQLPWYKQPWVWVAAAGALALLGSAASRRR